MSDEPEPRSIVFALGSNLGDSLATLRGAARRLGRALTGARASAVYATPPEGGAQQPGYLNAAVAGVAALTPIEALALARGLEADWGRERPFPGSARTLDVDVVFVGDAVIDTPELTLPHPRWRERDFVVVPLLDVAPGFRDPCGGTTPAETAVARGWSRSRFPVILEQDALLLPEVP